MNEPLFDHEKLDVYRLSIDYVAYSYSIASGLTCQNRHARDQWIRAAQTIPLNIAEGNGKHSLKRLVVSSAVVAAISGNPMSQLQLSHA